MGGRKSVIPPREIPVEGSNNRILPVWIINMAGPLADAGSAGIGQYYPTDFFEGIQKAIFLNGEPYELTSRRNGEFCASVKIFFDGLFCNRSRPADIFIRGIGAGPDQGHFQFFGPMIILDRFSKF